MQCRGASLGLGVRIEGPRFRRMSESPMIYACGVRVLGLGARDEARLGLGLDHNAFLSTTPWYF